jgi:spore maturation protein SpmA
MLNIIWTSFFLIAALSALGQVVFLGNTMVLNKIMEAMFSMAKTGFEISLGLTGVMTLWLGLMKIGEAAGAIRIISRWAAPVLEKLFPDIPPDHPAFGAMTMNIAANVLGLDNAATPLGLKAIRELQTLNDNSDTASNSQIMFLVINTSSVTLIPVTIFTYLYQLGYANPTELFIPILLATSCSSLAGLIAVSAYQRINLLQPQLMIFLGGFCLFMALLITYMLSLNRQEMQTFSLIASNSVIFGIITIFMLMAIAKRINVYDEFIKGAKDGFQVAISIIPYLVAMLVAIGVFRASGAMEIFLAGLTWIFQAAGLLINKLGIIEYHGGPMAFIDALPTAMMKPLSGSGARGLMIETIKIHGVDSLVARIVAVIQGSTETTFYIIAVYFGSVGVRHTRHAVPCGLIADGVGVTAAIIICYLFFG